MKKIFMFMVAFTMAATSVKSQIVTSTSRQVTYNEVKTVSNDWQELTFDAEIGTITTNYDDGDDARNYTGLKIGWARAIPVSQSVSLYVKPGVDLQYIFSNDDNYNLEKISFVSVVPACDFGYLFTFGGSSIELFPYIGLTARVNLWGQGTYYDEEDIDLFDSDEGDCNRFQLGLRSGIDAHFGNFIVGIGYGTDLMEFAEDTKTSNFNVKVGLKF